jgi:hypothetical protein
MGENYNNNESDLDKGNILKPTFNTLTEEGRQAFEAYIVDLRELFFSCCEVTCQGTSPGYYTDRLQQDRGNT